MFGIKHTDSKVKYMNDVSYKQDKLLFKEKRIWRYGYSYKQRKKSDTDNKHIVAKWIETVIIHMWITLTCQMFRLFLWL